MQINDLLIKWPDMMGHYFENKELKSATTSLLTEKILLETIMHDILQTPIPPGITLNQAFGKIHHWANTSWAARIWAFLVKQSNEETESINAQKQAMIHDVWEKLCSMDEKEELKEKWTDIIGDAFKLNVVIQCQDKPPIEILQIEEGVLSDGNLMKAYNEGDTIAVIVSTHFSTGDDSLFFIPLFAITVVRNISRKFRTIPHIASRS